MLDLVRLFFPLPLLIIGAMGLNTPWIVIISLALAIAPLLSPQLLLGRPAGKFYFTGSLTLFVAGALVGIWVSYNYLESLPLFLTIVGSISLLFIVANPTLPLRAIAKMIALVGALFALYFATQYAYFQYPLEKGFIAHLARQFSLNFPILVVFTPHPNAIATFLEGTFFVTLGLMLIEEPRWRWLWRAIMMLISYGLFISDSRGVMLGIALSLGIWAVLRAPRNWRSPLAIVGGTAFGVLASVLALSVFVNNSVLPPFVARFVHGFGGRYILYQNSVELLRDYPFTGVGLGNTFAMVYSRYQLLINVPFLYYAHNMPLSVWLGQGLLGIIGFVWLLVQFYSLVWQVERYPKHILHRALFRGSWLGVTATLVHGLFDASQFSSDRWTMPLLFALIGMVIVLGRRSLRSHPSAPMVRKWGTWAWGCIAIILVVAIAFAPKIIAQWQVNVGALHQTYGELAPDDKYMPRAVAMQRARQSFEKVLKWQPQNSVANRRLGMMALDDENFELAVAYLETAYRHEAHNQPTLKALGYAYLWTGKFDRATELFQQVIFRSRLVDELYYYYWYWGEHHRDDLSKSAMEMSEVLKQ